MTTEKLDFRQQLARSEARFRAMIENNADGVIIVNENGLVLYLNPAAEKILGLQAEDFIGVIFGYPIATQSAIELDLISKNGRPKIVEMRVARSEWDGSQAYIASLRDISVQKHLQKELEAAHRKIQAQLEEKSNDLDNTILLTAHREARMTELKEVIRKLRTQLLDAGHIPVANDPWLE